VRAVIDTNVWVSSALEPAGLPARVFAAYTRRRFDFVTSEALLEELTDVLSRPRLTRRHGLSPDEQADLIAELRLGATIVPIGGTIRACRDPDDDVLLETAVGGQAVYVVSGDLDTLAEEVRLFLAGHAIRVLTVRQFLHELESESPLLTSETPAP
jgi:uncharacterized protein